MRGHLPVIGSHYGGGPACVRVSSAGHLTHTGPESRTHAKPSTFSSLFLPFLFSFRYSLCAFRRCFPKFPTLVLLPSPHCFGFSSWCECLSYSLMVFLFIYFYITFSPYSSRPRPLLRHASLSLSKSICLSLLLLFYSRCSIFPPVHMGDFFPFEASFIFLSSAAAGLPSSLRHLVGELVFMSFYPSLFA